MDMILILYKIFVNEFSDFLLLFHQTQKNSKKVFINIFFTYYIYIIKTLTII